MSNKSIKEVVTNLWITRDQIARYLHDGPAQSIAAVAMRLNIAKRLVDRDNSKAIEELDQAEEQTRRAAKEMRYLLFATQAKSLRNAGLVAGMQDLAEQTKETFGVQVHLDIDPKSGKKVDKEKQSLLFLMALEAMTMARKHNGVKNIWFRLHIVEKDLLLLDKHDDGNNDEIGSEAMEQLVNYVEGKIEIVLGDDDKYHLQIWLPLNNKAVERFHRKG